MQPDSEPKKSYPIYKAPFQDYLLTWLNWDIQARITEIQKQNHIVTAIDLAAPPDTLIDANLFDFGIAIGDIPETSSDPRISYICARLGEDSTWQTVRTILDQAQIPKVDIIFFRPLGGIAKISEIALTKVLAESVPLLSQNGDFFGHIYTDHADAPMQMIRRILKRINQIEGLNVEIRENKRKHSFQYKITRLKVSDQHRQKIFTHCLS